jgi:DNA mismatch repair protein MutL
MASRIRLLHETVANQIAAGEVVERPASVVKELVENSLDAGARRLEIAVERGGRSLIRVTDDGTGMSYDDALLCLERHATSKIEKADDLLSIRSYGFRGEAIPSIASVSKFRLVTREHGADSGTEIVIDGGRLVRVGETGCAPGTSIEVRSLFSNIPARRKFLRTEETEWSHIEQLLRLVALVRPEVALFVEHNGRPVHQLPAAPDLRSRLLAVFGRRWLDDTLPVEATEGGLRLTGVIGRPGVSRGNRQEQHLFVNGRPVQNNTLNYGLLEGYHNALMKGRYPVAVLFLEMDPAGVDVNVHPSKREVRFRDDQTLRQFIVRAVAGALREMVPAPVEASLSSTPTALPAPVPSPAPSGQGTPAPAPTPPVQPAWFGVQPRPPFPSFDQLARTEAPSLPRNHDLRVIGILLDLYIIAENQSGIVLIDQHAAHERILFEQMLKRVAEEQPLSQSLLLPATVELPPPQADFLRQQLDALRRIGLGVAELGGGTFLIDALPPMIKTSSVAEFFRSVLVDLEEAGGETRRQRRLSEEIVAKTVCRHAVKANDPLKPGEVEKLLIDLHACDLPYTCPHGRPTMILLSRQELEKKFGRLA